MITGELKNRALCQMVLVTNKSISVSSSNQALRISAVNVTQKNLVGLIKCRYDVSPWVDILHFYSKGKGTSCLYYFAKNRCR